MATALCRGLPGLVAVVDEDNLLRVLGEDVRVLLG
jgi:hypothetical protein